MTDEAAAPLDAEELEARRLAYWAARGGDNMANRAMVRDEAHPRREYHMNKRQLAELKEACKPSRSIYVPSGNPGWQTLGDEMGFEWQSVTRMFAGNHRCFEARAIPGWMPRHMRADEPAVTPAPDPEAALTADIEADIEVAMTNRYFDFACLLAADLPHPRDHRDAMIRIFNAARQGGTTPRQEPRPCMTFKNHAVKLNHLNLRRELAGKNAADGRAASDLRLTVKGGNDLLDKLSPHLRGCFYRSDDEKLKLGDLTQLIHPPLQNTLTYDQKCAGYTVALDHGIDEETPIVLADCQVNDFKLTMQEGGTVVIVMRVQFHPEDGQLDLLKEMLMQDVKVSMTPPEAKPEKKPDLLGDLETKRAARKGRKQPEAATAH